MTSLTKRRSVGLFIAAALTLTFPLWITVNYLGEPDNGVIVAAYLGSLLMELHQYDEGFSLICKAAELLPSHSGILVNLGNGAVCFGFCPFCIRASRFLINVNIPV